MVRPEVVAYLQENLNRHKLAELRQQLVSEDVSAADFEESLKAAQRVLAQARRRSAGRFLMVLGLIVMVGASFVALMSKKPAPAAVPVVSSDRGFIGRSGYVLRLPDGYAAVTSIDPSDSRAEIVHFCKAGTDPTTLLNPGLFGQLGIVRLRVRPNPFGDGLIGLAALTEHMLSSAQRSGDKYASKNIQVSYLRGIQLTYEMPNARVETYIIGQTSLYSFYAGQDDELYQGLINSLRETQEGE